jgi:pyruvate kinase
MSELRLIVTQGPYSTFLEQVAGLDLVEGIRLNTVMPVKDGEIEATLAELKRKTGEKTLWVDLKARQLRVREFANTPYTAVTISHRISVDLPATAHFDNGKLAARLVAIDGYRLILEDYAGRLIGPGESVNIVDESLTFLDHDLLTAKDLEYVAACRQVGIEDYMLSYVERPEDLETLRAEHPGCRIMAKIESQRGMERLEEIAAVSDGLMAARGDLFTEVPYPHLVVPAVREIFEVDGPGAVVASRLLLSLLRHPVPSNSDIMDIAYLLQMGYRRFMIGDDICFKRDILMRAVRIFGAMDQDLL